MVKLIEKMDSGTRKTTLCKTQQRYISNAIRKIKHDEVSFNHGHFFTSGLIRRGNIVVYFSTSDFRYFPNEAYVRYADASTVLMNRSRNTQTSITHLDMIIDSALKGNF